MAKKGCVGGGCFLIVGLLVLAAIFLSRIPSSTQKTTEAPQKPVGEELAMPAGTVLKDGIGIVILVDTSGSMLETVSEAGGVRAQKIEIARRVTQVALDSIADFSAKNPGKVVYAGLTQFSNIVKMVLPVAPPDPAQVKPAVSSLMADGQTAIGEAMVSGKQQLNRAGLKKQYMIVITDGINTEGRSPEEVVRALQALPENQRPVLYLIAFDIGAKVFEPLVKQGITVSEARDARSLQSALDYILYEKILVEQE